MSEDAEKSSELREELNRAVLLPHSFHTRANAITASANEQADQLRRQRERMEHFLQRTNKLVM
jgi:hypothetical protein